MNIIAQLIYALLHVLPPDFIKKELGVLINSLEDKIKATPNKFDDATILPLLEAIKSQLGL